MAYLILDHERYGCRIVLVDTPGFDDMKWTEEKILKLIGDWLKKTYVELNTQWARTRLNNYVCADTKKEYSYGRLCMCTTSLSSRGCPRYLTALWAAKVHLATNTP